MLRICAKTSKALNMLAKKSSRLPATVRVVVEYIGRGGVYVEVTIEPDERVATGEEGTTAGGGKSHSTIDFRVSRCLIEFCSLRSTESQNLGMLTAAGGILPPVWSVLKAAENRVTFVKSLYGLNTFHHRARRRYGTRHFHFS